LIEEVYDKTVFKIIGGALTIRSLREFIELHIRPA
jgi:hypothetical protein